MDPQGKTALVTGGAQRVGRAISLALARAGTNLIINYHSSRDVAEETAAEARALGVEVLIHRADVANCEQVETMVTAAVHHFGSVDILINNASLFQKTPLPTKDFEPWHRVTGVLIDGAFYCANAVARAMLQNSEGVIVNIVDLSAWQPWPDFAAHSIGKAALLALTRQLALELAPIVRVNAVAPGPVLPPRDYSPARIERTARRTLLNRWGTPDDVAEAVLFLIRANYVTGEVIVVDGGERFGHRKRE